jgi:hypothetical protein
MARTLLQIAQQALGEIGLTCPTLIVSNTDPTAVQILSLANREGAELTDVEGGWPELRGEQTIPLVPGQEAYDFPADLLYYRQGTGWDDTSGWQVAGPTSDREWQQIKAGYTLTLPVLRYRIMGGQIHFSPVPGAGASDSIVFEYMSACWCKSKTGTLQTYFQADTDVPILNDDLLILGLKWRLLAAKGMNYAEERATYDAAVARKQGRATTSGPLPLNRRRRQENLAGFVISPAGIGNPDAQFLVEG